MQLNFNGTNLDLSLEGYLTVNVEGRGLFVPTLETVKIDGRAGDVVVNDDYPARDIKIYFYLESNSNVEKLRLIRYLNNYLKSDENVNFYLTDEEGYRVGRISSFENPPYDQLRGIGNFTIHCQDPFVYSTEKTEKNNSFNPLKTGYSIDLSIIDFVVDSSVKKIIIKNITSGKKIILNYDFKAGDKVRLEKNLIYINNQNKMDILDFVESDYQDFEVIYGQELLISPDISFNITYRNRWL